MAEIIQFPKDKARKSPRAEFAEMFRMNRDRVYVKTIAKAILDQNQFGDIRKEIKK